MADAAASVLARLKKYDNISNRNLNRHWVSYMLECVIQRYWPIS